MATWRPVGIVTPADDSWLWLESQIRGSFFMLRCEGIPQGSQAIVQLQEWAGQRPGPIKPLKPLREQVFSMGAPGDRLIAIRKTYPPRVPPDQSEFQVSLFEWVEAIKPDPEVKLWLPGAG